MLYLFDRIHELREALRITYVLCLEGNINIPVWINGSVDRQAMAEQVAVHILQRRYTWAPIEVDLLRNDVLFPSKLSCESTGS